MHAHMRACTHAHRHTLRVFSGSIFIKHFSPILTYYVLFFLQFLKCLSAMRLLASAHGCLCSHALNGKNFLYGKTSNGFMSEPNFTFSACGGGRRQYFWLRAACACGLQRLGGACGSDSLSFLDSKLHF